MAHASSAPNQRVEWMWKSNADPFSKSEPAEWHSYSDVETAIIEETFAKKQSEVLLDDYHINFKRLLQISNNDLNNQRPVKRVVNKIVDTRLRENRFMPNPILPSASFLDSVKSGDLDDPIKEHFNVSHLHEGGIHHANTRQMLVERAADGLIVEGKKMGRQREAEWMAHQLLRVKKRTIKEVQDCCFRLYSMESFFYKKLNEWMRLYSDPKHQKTFQNKVPTFGPFVLLLDYRKPISGREKMTVYRGANLSNDLIEQYRHQCGNESQGCLEFPAFTSTTRNRALAEQFGNTLFVIEIDIFDGFDISLLSDYPHEEEFLLRFQFLFQLQDCTFDEVTNKWVMHLRTIIA